MTERITNTQESVLQNSKANSTTCLIYCILAKPIQNLTHYQTTNFRPFQTERVCRRQFQIRQIWQRVIQMGRKHWEKEKLLNVSNFCFYHTVFKSLVSQGHQKASLCGNGLQPNEGHSQ